jgi:hypothetical protein
MIRSIFALASALLAAESRSDVVETADLTINPNDPDGERPAFYQSTVTAAPER